jgi:cytochrome bd-type quinol oxidase subunit 2
MAKRIIYILITSLIMVTGVFGFMATAPAHAATIEPKSQACEALGAASGSSTDCSNPAGPDVSNTLKLGINAFSLIIGVAAIIMIIVGGFKYITSQGESANTAGAKNTILYAIIGLVVVALAQVIVRFVLTRTTNPCPASQTVQVDGTCA